MNRIRLFIGGTEVEQGDELTVALTYQLTDLYTPTAVRTPYSKTITIDGTPHNNEIFGNYWKPMHTVSVSGRSSGVEFNPAKRVKAAIFVDGVRLIQGYIRLDSINRTGSVIKYNVTFYSEIGNFFYSLKNNDKTGDELTLADIVPEFSFKINRQTVKQAWENGSICDGLISFAPCYNGFADDFDSDKAIVNLNGSDSFISEQVSGGTMFRAFHECALAELGREYSEYEMRDFRSYNQRPVISVRKVIESICDSTDYDVHLDDRFFNDSNPYYADTWMTLPMFRSMDGISSDNYYSTTFRKGLLSVFEKDNGNDNNNWLWGSENAHNQEIIPFTDGDLVYDELTSNKDMTLTGLTNGEIQASIDVSPVMKPLEPTALEGINVDGRFQWSPSMYCLQLVAYELDVMGNQRVVGASKMHAFLTVEKPDNGQKTWLELIKSKRGGEGYIVHPNCRIRYDKASGLLTLQSEGTVNTLTLSCPRRDRMRFVLHCDFLGMGIEDVYGYEYAGFKKATSIYLTSDSNIVSKQTWVVPYVKVSGGGLSLLGGDSPRTDAIIRSKTLLNGTCSPFDFILNYAKMFGLLFVKGKDDKRIDIMMRDTFYHGKKKDISSMIDYGKDFSISPLLFDTNWYRFSSPFDETHCTERYSQDFGKGVIYGEAKVSTNYGFPADVREMIPENVFKTAAESLESSVCFRTLMSASGKEYPSLMIEEPLKYNLYSGGDISGDTLEVTNAFTTGYYSDFNLLGGFDLFPKICLRDSDGGSVDGSGVLLFYRGLKPLTDVNGMPITAWISDDFDHMYTLNGGTPCHLITDTDRLDNSTSIAVKIDSLPSFGRITNDGMRSLDFGVPRETFVPNLQIGEYATVYNRFWKSYISDMFDVNTKMATLWVRFDEPLTEQSLRAFYYFEGSLWILNKVTDYNPVSDSPVKCEFIKIKRTSDYNEGQEP